MNRPSDDHRAMSDLGQRLRQGDSDSLDELIDSYYVDISRFVQRLTAWEVDTEDVVQDVFLTAWRNAGSYRGDASLLSWLRAIARNECRRRFRRITLWRRWLTSSAAQQSEQIAGSADQPLCQAERAKAVRRAIGTLSQRDREVIVLHYLEHQTIEQIAEQLGLSRNAVEVRLHRARQRLKPHLSELIEETGL